MGISWVKCVRRTGGRQAYVVGHPSTEGFRLTVADVIVVIGTGMNRAQIDVVQGRITDGTLFPNISAKILDEATELIRGKFSHLQRRVNDIVKRISFDLSVALEAEGKRSVMSPAERGQRDALAKEVKRLQSWHGRVLETIKDLE